MASMPANGRRRPVQKAAATTLAVTLSAALVSGCGGKSGASDHSGGKTPSAPATTVAALPADQPQKHACGLVTQAEVEAAVGARVSPGREDMQAGRSVCAFPLAAGPDQSVAVISTSSSGVPAAFDAAREHVESPQAVSAGDQAFVSGGQAVVRKGTTMVTILIAVRRSPAQLSPAATKLAQAAGNRL